MLELRKGSSLSRSNRSCTSRHCTSKGCEGARSQRFFRAWGMSQTSLRSRMQPRGRSSLPLRNWQQRLPAQPTSGPLNVDSLRLPDWINYYVLLRQLMKAIAPHTLHFLPTSAGIDRAITTHRFYCENGQPAQEDPQGQQVPRRLAVLLEGPWSYELPKA